MFCGTPAEFHGRDVLNNVTTNPPRAPSSFLSLPHNFLINRCCPLQRRKREREREIEGGREGGRERGRGHRWEHIRDEGTRSTARKKGTMEISRDTGQYKRFHLYASVSRRDLLVSHRFISTRWSTPKFLVTGTRKELTIVPPSFSSSSQRLQRSPFFLE